MKAFIFSLCLVIMIGTASYAQTGIAPDSKPAVGASGLPEHVKAYIDKKYPGYIVVTFRKSETQEMTTMPYYDVEVQKGLSAWDVRVSEEGKLIQRSKRKSTSGVPVK